MANTKLLLLEDVNKLGRSGDIISVKPGFARNYLVPKGRAIPATKQALHKQVKLQEERAKKTLADKAEAEVTAKKLIGSIVETKVKVDPEGHMYGSVSALDIVTMLAEQVGVIVDRHYVALSHPIKTTGIHKVTFKFPEGVEAEITVKVLSESGEVTQVVTEKESMES